MKYNKMSYPSETIRTSILGSRYSNRILVEMKMINSDVKECLRYAFL